MMMMMMTLIMAPQFHLATLDLLSIELDTNINKLIFVNFCSAGVSFYDTGALSICFVSIRLG